MFPDHQASKNSDKTWKKTTATRELLPDQSSFSLLIITDVTYPMSDTFKNYLGVLWPIFKFLQINNVNSQHVIKYTELSRTFFDILEIHLFLVLRNFKYFSAR